MRRKEARWIRWSYDVRLNKSLYCHTSKDTILLGKEDAVVYSVIIFKFKMVDLAAFYTSYYYIISMSILYVGKC